MADIMTVRPPDDLKQILTQAAKQTGIPRNALILQILWDWAKKNEAQRGLADEGRAS